MNWKIIQCHNKKREVMISVVGKTIDVFLIGRSEDRCMNITMKC